jgi:hypothetical protein
MWTAETILVCALTLLQRSVDSFPPIVFVDSRPAYVSHNADAYVLDGTARIHLITSTAAFARAQRAMYKCGELQALRKIASIVVHEEWHVRHGRDEAGAYAAQLSTLAYLGAGPGNPLYYEAQKLLRAALRAGRVTTRR